MSGLFQISYAENVKTDKYLGVAVDGKLLKSEDKDNRKVIAHLVKILGCAVTLVYENVTHHPDWSFK